MCEAGFPALLISTFTSIGLNFTFHFQGFIPDRGGLFFPLDD
jgi:hypothetical protein